MHYDCIIVGGGIVGLATAWKILEAKPGTKLLLLEKESTLAKHQTGNNSGVIHSGIYYKPGSLKAKNCVDGYALLIEFAKKYDIPYDLCGKIIVATTPEEIPFLETVYKRGLENGLTGISYLNAEELKVHEPHVNGLKGIHVPYTGIIDYKAVSEKLGSLIREAGGKIILDQQVESILQAQNGATLKTQNQEYSGRLIVNCAGLFSDKVAALTEPNLNIRIIPFRGEYFELKPEKEYLVKNLIYPVPDPNFPFLGVHFTRMIKGGIEAGPNAVFAFKREGYTRTSFKWSEFYDSISWPGFRKVAVKYWKTGFGEYYRSFSKAAFTKALQKLIPEIQEDDLVAAGAGVRAQACDRTGGLIDDFLFLEKDYIINVLNAPSPAATSSLSIGATISEMALKKLHN
jgi:L-2-hydroxyglutarate oxidase